MLDIRLIRENPEVVRKDLKRRGDLEKLKQLEDLIKKDREWRALMYKVQELRNRRNVVTKEIAELKAAGKPVTKKLAEMRKIPGEIKKIDGRMGKLKADIDNYMLRLPNILHKSVPVGRDENDNVELRKWGKKPKFPFTPRSHVDLLRELDLADTERAGKVSGARFYFLKNELVLMDMALRKLALDFLAKQGFTMIEPPSMLRRKPYEGVVDLGDFEEMLYKIENEDLYLIATSEHPIAGFHMDEIVDGSQLPLRYAGVSPCFRKEAGAHGKDTKGIFRVHQFNKVEQFVFSTPEDSWKEHEKLVKNAETLFKKLELPHRVVNVCTGDMGSIAAKKYDIELWMPVQNKYREVASCSNCTDYQARRLNIRCGKAGGEKRILHTLNSTAIATSRTMVAILENFQNKDGSVTIPRALRPLMNGLTKIAVK